MTDSKNNSALEFNKIVEQMLLKGKWQDALNFWIENTDSLTLIKWLAQFISQSSSEEDSVLLQSIVKWKEGDEEQRWEIFKKRRVCRIFYSVRSPGVIVIYITRKFESDFISTSPCTVMFRKKNYLWNIMNQSCKCYDTPVEGIVFFFSIGVIVNLGSCICLSQQQELLICMYVL
ncbi:type VI secretion protein [Escherichia coli]|uniref:type VI secretion protein n=1 Tax=Escherichia coli TaxID=562 RepID=UPI003B2888C1